MADGLAWLGLRLFLPGNWSEDEDVGCADQPQECTQDRPPGDVPLPDGLDGVPGDHHHGHGANQYAKN